MLARVRYVLVVSFDPFRTATVKLRVQTKTGHVYRACPLFAPFWPPALSAPRPERRTVALNFCPLTRLDVLFNLVDDCVP